VTYYRVKKNFNNLSYRPAKSITNLEITRSGTCMNQCWFAYRKLRRLALEKHPARCNAWNSYHLIVIKLRCDFIFNWTSVIPTKSPDNKQ